MTIQQFYQLDEMDKVSAIVRFGRLMAQNTEEDKRVFIYHLDSFFVRTSYASCTDELTEISCYTEVDQLIPHCRRQIFFTDPSQREYQIPEA